jgi:alpha-beta hydrolase superfamily lysophospholipase
MKNQTFAWQSFDGLPLFAQSWEPDSAPRAVVCLVHGLGEHSGRYQHVAQAFTQAGLAVLTFDLRGHGQSGGTRGHTPSADAYLNDIDQLLAEAGTRYPGAPRFLYGHSLGGLLVLFYTLKRKPAVKGVISTSPALATPLSDQKLKIAMSKVLGPLLPTLGMASGLDANLISRRPEVVEKYNKDPLVHGVVTFGFGATMIQAMEYTNTHAAQFPAPLLLLHGEKDAITYAAGSRAFAGQAGASVTFKTFPLGLHELHNEPEQDEVIRLMVEWISSSLI